MQYAAFQRTVNPGTAHWQFSSYSHGPVLRCGGPDTAACSADIVAIATSTMGQTTAECN